MLEEGNKCGEGLFKGRDEITLGNCITPSSIIR